MKRNTQPNATQWAWMPLALAVALACAGMSLAGCGGSDSSTKHFTVTFDADNGSAGPFRTESVRDGSFASEPGTDPVKEAEGLYETGKGAYGCIFMGWRLVSGGEMAAEPFDFGGTPITANITLKAKWELAHSVDLGSTAGANIVAKAFAHARANTASAFLLMLGGDYEIASTQNLNAAGASLTIRGIGSERTITYTNTTGNLFSVVTTSVAQARLTLEDNVTLTSREATGSALVFVENALFTMRSGSKITGHRTSNGNGAVNTAGTNTPRLRFVMEAGAAITDNHTTNVASWAAGGVAGTAGDIQIKGGTVTGNTCAYSGADTPSDVVAVQGYSRLILSGSPAIGTIIHSGAATSTVDALALAGAYTPAANPFLHLTTGTSTATLADITGFYTDRSVVNSSADYDVTAADIGKFTLGDFRTASASSAGGWAAADHIDAIRPNFQLALEGDPPAGVLKAAE